jgi:hypothetical protein
VAQTQASHWQTPLHVCSLCSGHCRVAVSPELHTPVSLQVVQFAHFPLLVSQTRLCVPHMPQVRVVAPSHICPGQAAFHLHVAPHVWVPEAPHVRAAPGTQSPSFEHAPHSDHVPVFVSHLRVCVPQLPHARELSPVQRWPVHAASHMQLPAHVWVPDSLAPQRRVESGEHTPSPEHVDHADHMPAVMSQVRLWVPQYPQACVAGPVHL